MIEQSHAHGFLGIHALDVGQIAGHLGDALAVAYIVIVGGKAVRIVGDGCKALRV